MNTSINNYDTIEKLIFEEGLRIEAVDVHPELDMMLVVLNTKAVLHQRLSSYPRLTTPNKEALLQFELVGSGTGIHWPALDEDLSLKGLLRDALRSVVKKEAVAA